MYINVVNNVIYLTIDGITYEVDNMLQNLINNDTLLLKLSISDIFDLFYRFGGIPDNLKDFLVKKIKLYGDSDQVASFTYKGIAGWLDKAQRSSILNLLNLSPAMTDSDENQFSLILSSKVVNIPVSELVSLITKLENYSYQCLVATTKHLEAVEDMENLDDILNYDYTTGYPDKIVIE